MKEQTVTCEYFMSFLSIVFTGYPRRNAPKIADFVLQGALHIRKIAKHTKKQDETGSNLSLGSRLTRVKRRGRQLI